MDLVRCPAPPVRLALGLLTSQRVRAAHPHTDQSRSRNPASAEAAEQRGSPARSTDPASTPKAIPGAKPPSLLSATSGPQPRTPTSASPRHHRPLSLTCPPSRRTRDFPTKGNGPVELLNKAAGAGVPDGRPGYRSRRRSAVKPTGRCSRTASPSRPWQVARSPLAAGREPFLTVDRRSGA